MSLFEILLFTFIGGVVAGACSSYGPFFSLLGGIVGVTFFGLYYSILALIKEKEINKTLFSLLSLTLIILVFYINHIFFYSDNYLESILGVRQMLLNYIYVLIMVYILWNNP